MKKKKKRGNALSLSAVILPSLLRSPLRLPPPNFPLHPSPKISTKEAQIRIYIGYFFSLLALAGLVFGFLGNGTVASCTAIGIMMYRMGVLSQ